MLRSVLRAAALTGVLALCAAPSAHAADPENPPPGRAQMGWKMHDDRPANRTSGADTAVSGVPGIDVSSWQGNVDWSAQRDAGNRFAYVKATEGTGYTNPYFAQQYNGSYNVGMIRGAYHFALPNKSSGRTQANFFVRNGGGWSSDGKTLPGALDMEWNPYGATCYGKTKSQMRSWMNSFLNRYKTLTGRYPVIYTNTNWWNQCVGSDTSFANKSPLWIARYGSSAGSLPPGWGWYTFWQYTDNPIDKNVFNGSYTRLKVLAKG